MYIDGSNNFRLLPQEEIAYVQGAYGLIQDVRSQLLMIRLKDSRKLFFPGGKLEPGENNHEALIREICEETDQTVLPNTIDFLVQQNSYLYHPQKEQGFHYEAFYYTCQINHPYKPLPSTHEGEAIWQDSNHLDYDSLAINADFVLLKWLGKSSKNNYTHR